MLIEALVPMLAVADLARSLQFYGKLGFEAESTVETAGATVRASLRNGRQRLLLQRRVPDGARPSEGDTVICLYVASAHEAHAWLARAGLRPPPVRRHGYGLDGFDLRDPDGHLVAVVSEAVQLA